MQTQQAAVLLTRNYHFGAVSENKWMEYTNIACCIESYNSDNTILFYIHVYNKHK